VTTKSELQEQARDKRELAEKLEGSHAEIGEAESELSSAEYAVREAFRSLYSIFVDDENLEERRSDQQDDLAAALDAISQVGSKLDELRSDIEDRRIELEEEASELDDEVEELTDEEPEWHRRIHS